MTGPSGYSIAVAEARAVATEASVLAPADGETVTLPYRDATDV